jgi:hypothetical protein
MTGTYKDFYKFVQLNSPDICNLWEDFNNRGDPTEGDEYMYFQKLLNKEISYIIVYDGILYDADFDNGVAFYYLFHRKDNGKEIKIHTINAVDDYEKLTDNDKTDLFRFWRDCIPIIK